MSDNKLIVDRADWLVDAVATATQNRMFLRGDPECDEVACVAIKANGAKAIQHVLATTQRDLETANLRIAELESENHELRMALHDERDGITATLRNDQIEILQTRLTEAERRLANLKSQFHTNSSVSMDGMLRWSPRHTLRDIKGRTFEEAVDSLSSSPPSEGDKGGGA